jgi:hypothetical protein
LNEVQYLCDELTGRISVLDVRGDEEETLGLRRDVDQHGDGDQPGEHEADAVQRDVQLQRLVKFHSFASTNHLDVVVAAVDIVLVVK